MASNHGKTFEADMLKSVRSWGWWAERFRDNTFAAGRMTASHSSPPDMICVDPGTQVYRDTWVRFPVLMELKAIRHSDDIMKACIPLSRCDGHQLERLLEFPGEAYVAVMWYEGSRALRRSATLIPAGRWATAEDTYGRLSLRLSTLREDLPARNHLRWVGRAAEIGPWVRCTRLGDEPKDDR